MKVISWNYIGLGSSVKAEAIKDILKSEKPNIMLIQETKMEGEDVMELRVWKNYAGKAVSFRGTSGGNNNLMQYE